MQAIPVDLIVLGVAGLISTWGILMETSLLCLDCLGPYYANF